jgi:hypothetical protein
MRRTVLTTAQWALLCTIVSFGTVASAAIDRHFGGYWYVVVYVVLMALIALVLRFRFETATERLTRRSSRKRQYGTAFRPGSTHTVRGQMFVVMSTKSGTSGRLTVDMQRTDQLGRLGQG